jgi:ABC-type multidrug transport system fused ATPase/permease subunit
VVIGFANWYILLSLPVIFGLMTMTFLFALPSYKECQRIENITKSPILNHINETTAGSSTIRVFGNNKQFEEKFIGYINQNILAYIFSCGTWNWFGLRISFISIILMCVSTRLCIIYRFEIDPILIGMSLSYIINLQDFTAFFLYSIGELEKNMVSI